MHHSIWLGNAPKNELLRRCEATWPWLRCEWNDSSLSNSSSYYAEAMRARNYAAASDWARLYVLYTHGGIYTDADVEILEPQELVREAIHADRWNLCTLGLEDPSNVCGAIIIAPPRHPFVAHMIHVYGMLRYDQTFGTTNVNGTTLLTRESAGRGDVRLLPWNATSPVHWSTIDKLSYEERHAAAKAQGAFAIHHFQHSWRGQ